MTQQQRVAVVTGASSGIGRATAIAFAKKGFAVVLAARGRRGLADAADACRAAGGRAEVVVTDVTDAGEVRALAERAIAAFGHVDVWASIVGVGAVGRFDEVPIEAHARVIQANLVGHMHGAHAILPHFRERRRGLLVNMGSIGGWAAGPYAASYAASKFGVRGFGESLRAELASSLPHVHVCDVFPTFVDTPGMAHGGNWIGKRMKPPPPLVDPRTVADAVVALADAPKPTVFVGSVALPARLAHALAPELVNRTAARLMEAALARAKAAPRTEGNLFDPSVPAAIDGGYRATPGHLAATAGLAALGLLAAWWLKRGPRAGA